MIATGTDINFLREQQKSLDATLVMDRKIARYTTIGVAVFALIVLVVFILRFVVFRQEQAITDRIDATTQTLKTLAPLEKEYVVYAQKVKLLFGVEKQREAKRKITAFFSNLIPKEDVLLEVRIDDKKNQLAFRVEAPDVFRALNLLKLVYADTVAKEGYVFAIDHLDRKPPGKYTMSGTLGFAQQPTAKSKK